MEGKAHAALCGRLSGCVESVWEEEGGGGGVDPNFELRSPYPTF